MKPSAKPPWVGSQSGMGNRWLLDIGTVAAGPKPQSPGTGLRRRVGDIRHTASMGKDAIRGQRALIAEALRGASVERLEATLDGTIGDAQAFCWGALRQFDRHAEPTSFASPRDFGLQHADLHYLLIGAQEAVSHAERVEQVLAALGRRQTLPPTRDMRERLLQMRNLLAEHRDERVLYWRLTGEHTPHVIAIYERFGMPAIKDALIALRVLGHLLPASSCSGCASLSDGTQVRAGSGECETSGVSIFGDRVTVPSDASSAAWLLSRLGGSGTVGGLVPSGFE